MTESNGSTRMRATILAPTLIGPNINKTEEEKLNEYKGLITYFTILAVLLLVSMIFAVMTIRKPTNSQPIYMVTNMTTPI